MNSKGNVLAVLALGAAMAFAIAGVSNGRSAAPAPERKVHPEPRHVAAPSHEASIAAVRRGARIRYLESDATAARARRVGRLQLHVPQAHAARGRGLRRHRPGRQRRRHRDRRLDPVPEGTQLERGRQEPRGRAARVLRGRGLRRLRPVADDVKEAVSGAQLLRLWIVEQQRLPISFDRQHRHALLELIERPGLLR